MMIDDVVVVVDVVDVVDVDVVDDDDNDDDDVFDGVMMGCDIFYSMSLNQLNSLCLLVASYFYLVLGWGHTLPISQDMFLVFC